MPFKHNQPNRHHIPKMKYRVTNWRDYERGLVQRGDIRFWIEEGALEAWIAPYRTTPGPSHTCKHELPGNGPTQVLEHRD